tara:strand:+ start:4421 stop:5680 length:1260 start_codon:yes stop_codon:yes gene_type:complete
MRLLFLYFLVCGISAFGVGEGWWKWRGPNGDGNWQGPKITKDLSDGGLERIWKTPVYPGYSGVTTRNGLIYLMDRPPKEKFGEVERVLCFDAQKRRIQWEYSYQSKYEKLGYGKGPRSSVTIYQGKAYCLGAMGYAHCLDALKGTLIWKRDLKKELKIKNPIWGFSAAPEPLDSSILYHVGSKLTGNMLALDAKTGKTNWEAGSDSMAGYCPPLLVEAWGVRQLICWGPNKIMGLPVGGGKEFWNFPYKVKYGVSIAKPIYEDGILLVSGYWNGSKAIRIEKNGGVKLLWSEEDDLRGLMGQPLYRDGICYLLDRGHGLTAFKLRTGSILWRDQHRLTAANRNPHASLVWTNKKKGDALSLNAEGELVFMNLSREKYHEYWREQVVGETWAHPAYSEDKVYLRDDRWLTCWQLPVKNEN